MLLHGLVSGSTLVCRSVRLPMAPMSVESAVRGGSYVSVEPGTSPGPVNTHTPVCHIFTLQSSGVAVETSGGKRGTCDNRSFRRTPLKVGLELVLVTVDLLSWSDFNVVFRGQPPRQSITTHRPGAWGELLQRQGDK